MDPNGFCGSTMTNTALSLVGSNPSPIDCQVSHIERFLDCDESPELGGVSACTPLSFFLYRIKIVK